MPLGGGSFIAQNKILPGTYHNFVSAARSYANLAERGYVALPMSLDWGTDGEIITLTSEDLQKNSLKILGYTYTDPALRPFREIFKNAHTIFIYKINEGKAAENTYFTARCKGTRGNALKTIVTFNVDDGDKFDVSTYLGTTLVDEQKAVSEASELVANDYAIPNPNAILGTTTGTDFAGGTNGEATAGAPWQSALDEFEAYGFNALVCPSSVAMIKSLFMEYTKRLRDEVGAKFQLVGHNLGAADHEGIIDVKNKATELDYALAFWVAGAAAGCAVNQSNTNKLYDGEYTVDVSDTKTSAQISALLIAGKFVFHKVGTETRVLEDVNTFTSYVVDKNHDFSMNQVIRVLDQTAIDTAHLFNTRYLGKVPNDQDGRISLWSDICKHRMDLQKIRAIQNFDSANVEVLQGETKKAVVVNEVIEPTAAMSQLYITTTVA